jgi:hypothetical protein
MKAESRRIELKKEQRVQTRFILFFSPPVFYLWEKWRFFKLVEKKNPFGFIAAYMINTTRRRYILKTGSSFNKMT